MTDKNKIYTAVTEMISISVQPRYEAEESNPAIGKFIYSYANNYSQKEYSPNF